MKTKKQDEEVNEQKPSEAKEEIQYKEVEAEPSPLISIDSNDDLLVCLWLSGVHFYVVGLTLR